METGKLLILFKYVGVVQQALPLRVCRQVKDSKLAAAARRAGVQAEDRAAAVGVLKGIDELKAGAVMCMLMTQAKQGDDSLDSTAHAPSKRLCHCRPARTGSYIRISCWMQAGATLSCAPGVCRQAMKHGMHHKEPRGRGVANRYSQLPLTAMCNAMPVR